MGGNKKKKTSQSKSKSAKMRGSGIGGATANLAAGSAQGEIYIILLCPGYAILDSIGSLTCIKFKLLIPNFLVSLYLANKIAFSYFVAFIQT